MAIGFQCFTVEVREEVGMRVDSMAARHGEYLLHAVSAKKSGLRQQEGLSRNREQRRTRSESRRCYFQACISPCLSG